MLHSSTFFWRSQVSPPGHPRMSVVDKPTSAQLWKRINQSTPSGGKKKRKKAPACTPQRLLARRVRPAPACARTRAALAGIARRNVLSLATTTASVAGRALSCPRVLQCAPLCRRHDPEITKLKEKKKKKIITKCDASRCKPTVIHIQVRAIVLLISRERVERWCCARRRPAAPQVSRLRAAGLGGPHQPATDGAN